MRSETLIIAGCLAVVVGGTLLWSRYGGDQAANVMTSREAVVEVAPPPDPSAPTTPTAAVTGSLPAPEQPVPQGAAPTASLDPASEAAASAPDFGSILVTTRLSSIHASPSASAPVLYAFPAGRQLRVIGRETGFARIEDVKSGATGWVDERLLAPSTATAASAPAAPSAPSASIDTESAPPPRPAKASKPAAIKQAATETEAPAEAPPKPAAKPIQRGLFGAPKRAERGGNGFPGFLNRAFGGR